MNFHKTIGFLASLLLIVGIGVPDSFAQQDPTITVTVAPTRITEGQTRSVTVSVTLSAKAPAGGVTVAVALPTTDLPPGAFLAASHDAAGTATAGFPSIEIAEGATTGTASVATITAYEDDPSLTVDPTAAEIQAAHDADTNYNYPRDKDFKLAVTASGHDDATGTLIVRDDDSPVGAITLTTTPPSLSVDGNGALTLNVSIAKAPGANNTVSLNITSTTLAGAAGPTATSTIEGTAKTPATAPTLTVGVADADFQASTTKNVTVTVGAVGYTQGTVTVPVIQRNADDVEGFRVTIESHADGDWVGFGAKKVKVQVRRVNRFAWKWTAFENLVVALRDTSTTTTSAGGGESNIYTLTAQGFTEVDEDIKFSTGTSTGIGSTTAGVAVDYSKADDAFTFQFQLAKVTTANTAANIFGSDTNTEETAQIELGRRRGVYATATFGGVTLSSNDTKKKVYTSPSLLETVDVADQVVGDGKLIKLDLLEPDNVAANALTVTKGDDELEDDAELKIGDTIKIAVNIDAQSRFSDGGVQVQVISLETPAANTGTVVGKGNRVLKTANFAQRQVIDAAGKGLETTWELTEGLIKLQAKAKSKTRDGANINANVLFEPDNAQIRVRARTQDQAGNFSAFTNAQVDLVADTRKPVIDVLYPAAGDYFSGAIGDTDSGYDQYLKPLKIRVDEDIDSMDVYAHKNAKISMWSAESRDLDLSLSVGDAISNAVGDTIIYDTQGLNLNGKTGMAAKLSSQNQGGSKVNLVIEVTDKVGNKSTKILSGVFHDEVAPKVTDFFPRNKLLDDNNEINNATRHPIITLPESVDSIAVVYDGSSGDDIVETVSGVTAMGEVEVPITTAFVQDRTYTLTIFVRDQAGNAADSDETLAEDMKFNAQFENPMANAYKVTYAETDSVIAGQVNDITIQAFDNNGTADNDDDDRDALTHKGTARISAWNADGGMASSVRFHGGGVTDNGDGSAMLDKDAWKFGKRTVKVMSNKAIGLTKLLVQNMETGEDGTQVATFDGAAMGFYVGAADFVGFEITAWQDGDDVSARGITGDFDLLVVPVDRYGNTSVRAYKGATGKKSEADSLTILDTRIKTAIEYKNGIDVTFASIPALEELNPLFVFPIELGGTTFPILLPDGRRSLTIQARVDNDNLNEDDMRSLDVRTTKVFNIVTALMPELTLWVPGSDVNEAGNDVVIPADPGSIMVTVAAEGYNAGSMVTFTKNGTMMDPVAADDNGVARLMITMSAAGSVTVSATDGDWPSDELAITFVEGPDEPVRMAYADANGDPVYLIDDGDMTVGVDDFQAFVMAYGSSAGDDNYNLQADINDDGMVNVADFIEFITSWGRTATGPATKPIVLLPGINENAEFSLSLGSERVVAGEFVAVDVSLANVEAVMGYGFTLNYDMDKFEFVSVASADEDLLASTGGETLFHHVVADGQVTVANGLYNGTAVSGGGDIVRFVFRVLYEFEDNARFEVADGLVFDPSQLSNPAVVAGVLELQSTPREFALHQNFPNPFNPDTTINYDLAESADVTLQIYNVLGQVVRTLVASEAQNAGRYQIRWNGMDERGVPVSSGIYFYQISADGKFSDVRKLMLLK